MKFQNWAKMGFFDKKFIIFDIKKAIFRPKSLGNSVLCPPIKRFSVQELLDLLWIYVTVKCREKVDSLPANLYGIVLLKFSL